MACKVGPPGVTDDVFRPFSELTWIPSGTHLYVLYEGYGFSVASLYCLGFVSGGLMSPITGPLVDKIGRKRAAILYCVLEIMINRLEQYPILAGLIISRMVGGFTTNLLSTVFEAWLDTEYRRQGLAPDKYEIIMRDSVIVSNTAAILSGFIAHALSERYGAVGPFQGAVTCTAIALTVIALVWNENYGTEDDEEKRDMLSYFHDAVSSFRSDRRMRRVGIIQGLTTGSIHIFIFLWAPALIKVSGYASTSSWGLDSNGDPAFGLIFGAFMAAGVCGGFLAPICRRFLESRMTQAKAADWPEHGSRPLSVELLVCVAYLVSGIMLAVPFMLPSGTRYSFELSLLAFLVFELMIGLFLPCEGVIRSIYFPSNARASIMTLPRIIVNAAVSVGVVSTNFIDLNVAFAAVSGLMIVAAALQASLLYQPSVSTL